MRFLQILAFTLYLGIWVSCNAQGQAMQKCTTGSDCPRRHCCVDSQKGVIDDGSGSVPPRSSLEGPGVCVKMGKIGTDCLVGVGDALHLENPKGIVKHCPCQPGSFCGPSGKTESDKYGRTGLCSFA